MTEEFTDLYQQSIRSQQEIGRLKMLLKEQEQVHSDALLQCYRAIINELDLIDAAARSQLSTPISGEVPLSPAITFDQMRQPLLAVLEQQGVKRIPAPFNLLSEWSVFVSPAGETRPADRSLLSVEKEGYTKGEWIIRPAILTVIKR